MRNVIALFYFVGSENPCIYSVPNRKQSYDVAFAVMGEEKKDELDKVVIKNDTLRKYFPRSYTPKQMEDTIIKLLEQWQRKQQRQNER